MGVLVLLALLQAKPDPARIDEAVARGVSFLKPLAANVQQELELVLLALVHGGVAPTDPAFSAPLERATGQPLAMTYRVALLAMTLEEVDRLRYQPAIARCAQFLLDSQADTGQWGYGRPTSYPDPRPVEAAPHPTADAGDLVIFEEPRPGSKPAVKQRIRVQQHRLLSGGGDNSNSAYAALGLRACHDAGISLPVEAVERAAQGWRRTQSDDQGWGYGGKGGSTGPMTAGALGARAILLHILGKDWRQDPVLNSGVQWLGANFKVSTGRIGLNCYSLYGVERAGVLCGVERFGPHEWYASGAAQLLPAQKGNGSWGSTADTAFAVLFLRRATRSMVESGR
jgi:hypothetical protein